VWWLLRTYNRPVEFPVDQMLILGGFQVEPRSYDHRTKKLKNKLRISYLNSRMIKKK